jgi:hypothetical protein
MLQHLATALSGSPASEEGFREHVRESPELSAYADVELPKLPFVIGLGEAVALVSDGSADPIYSAADLERYFRR